MSIIQKILDLMAQNNISAHQLEKRLGLANASIQAWRNGRGKPSADALAKLSDYFKVPVDYLLGVGLYGKLNIVEENLDTILSAIGNCEFQDMQEWLYKQLIEYLRIVKKLPILNVIPFLELFIKDINYDEETNELKIHWNFK